LGNRYSRPFIVVGREAQGASFLKEPMHVPVYTKETKEATSFLQVRAVPGALRLTPAAGGL
jgi:hypothetical protein